MDVSLLNADSLFAFLPLLGLLKGISHLIEFDNMTTPITKERTEK